MDWGSFIGPAVVAAVVSGIIAVVGMLVSRSTTIRLHEEKLGADQRLAERKFEFDKQLARERFAYDRRQAVFKRRFELAEQVLADAYRFSDLMKFVRNGGAWEGEGESRKVAAHESEGVKRLRTTYYVPLERLQQNGEFISALMARRTTCRAHFGEDAVKAFDAFYGAMHKVRVSAQMLIMMAGDEERGASDRELRERLLRDIWEPLGEHADENTIGKEIDKGVALIEGFCRPVLEWVDQP
ncbi:MAG: hypothetical protein IOC90_16815 [Methylocystis sp.]|jgi:hypothetical protein|nr:hypothetical protein [Methylocystis sp.]MCA3583440.1 hypothetical protein [Methylocystis sp.]MCA3589673.1 hypothetical protein [Methylocystis sp.]MCA3592735.1 hypothetical protein [Methylocystis sp.]